MNRRKRLLALLLLSMMTNAWAGLPLPELLSTEPARSRANQPFDLIYTLEFCGDVFAPDLPQLRSVELTGNTIRLTSLYFLDSCFPSQPYINEYRWRIGPLAAGTYEMELYAYTEQGGPQNSFPIASGEVTILPAIVAPKPNVVPAASTLGLLCMSILTVLAAMWGLRRR